MGWLKSLLLKAQKDAEAEETLQKDKPMHMTDGVENGDCRVRDEAASKGRLLRREFGFHDSCELSHVRMQDGHSYEEVKSRQPNALFHQQMDLAQEQVQQQRSLRSERGRRERGLCRQNKGHSSRGEDHMCQYDQLRKDSAESSPITVAPLCKGFEFVNTPSQAERQGRSSFSQEQARLADELSSCLKSLRKDMATLTEELAGLLDSPDRQNL